MDSGMEAQVGVRPDLEDVGLGEKAQLGFVFLPRDIDRALRGDGVAKPVLPGDPQDILAAFRQLQVDLAFAVLFVGLEFVFLDGGFLHLCRPAAMPGQGTEDGVGLSGLAAQYKRVNSLLIGSPSGEGSTITSKGSPASTGFRLGRTLA